LTVGVTGDAGGANAATLEVVRAALTSGDLAPLERALSPGVRWNGCRSRDEVLATLRGMLGGGAAPPQLSDAQLHGDDAVVHVACAARDVERWFVLTFDADGLVARMQGYDDRAVAERDLALRAAGPPADAPGRPPPAVNGLVAFVHVADMARSLAFYRLLGLQPVDSHAPDDEAVWAFLESGPAQLMVARADGPIDHRAQAVLFYLYADDLAGLRDHLVGHGVEASEIFDGTPGPKQEMRVEDPDGYVLMIAQIEG
jgi:catechol 2,3-dioxygenase-like lactoylglutathione lyase family enzyme